MDDIEKSQRFAERYNEIALNQSLRPVPKELFSGECFYCGEPVVYPRRWCNAACRDEWERENE